MKKISLFLFLMILFASIEGYSQQNSGFSDGSPYNKKYSPIFGKDIVINDTAMGDQRNVTMCSAYNGWLYAAYWEKTVGSSLTSMQFTIMKSENNGMNWNLLNKIQTGGPNEIITSFKMVATGNSLSNLKIFLGLVYYDSVYKIGTGIVPCYNGITGEIETEILNDQFVDIHDIDLATDFNFPASNSNPGSLAILYSKHKGTHDSLIFYSSADGGMTLNNHKVVSVVSQQYKFTKCSLNYGKSLSYNAGQYFAAWELKKINSSNFDHIYTAHTVSTMNGIFTTPVCLDSADAMTNNNCRNPVICCQYGNYDNNSMNITEVILVEKYDSLNSHKILGFYNRQSTVSDNFSNLTLTSLTHNEIEPSINFNPYDSTFMVTYYDSTDQRLPFILNSLDLTTPNSWQTLTSGYNDNSYLSHPHPSVILSYTNQQGVNTWINQRGFDDPSGRALFDSPSSTFTGINNENLFSPNPSLNISPNPCSSKCKLDFNLMQSSIVKIRLFTILGKSLETITDNYYEGGKYFIWVDLSSYPSGTYICNLTTDKYSDEKKIIVIR